MKLDYVEVWYSEQWNGWWWTAYYSTGKDWSEGEYTRAADARRGAERWADRNGFELGPWGD